MMNKDLFTDGLGHIDPDAVERMIRIEAELEKKQARRKRAWIKPVLIAAVLGLLICTVLLIVPYIPKTYDLDYGESALVEDDFFHTKDNVWIWYTAEDGQIKREYVHLPASQDNVLLTWKHLNRIDDQVKIDCQAEIDTTVSDTAVDFWDFLPFAQRSYVKSMTVNLSAQITSYPNYDALIESLQKTLAKYAGIDPAQIKVLIDGEQIGIADSLEFRHSLQGGGPVVGVLGNTLEITVGMTNASVEDIVFMGSWEAFVPNAMLTRGDSSVILHEEMPITNEYREYRLAPGQSREITYTFLIPEQAVCGEYDLVVSFGEQSFTFEKAVSVVGFGCVPSPSVSATEFHEFLQKYGFVTTDPEAFKTAVGTLSYHSGKSLLDIMTPVPIEYEEGYDGEEYGSDLFAYGYTLQPDHSCNNFFIGLALPDDMRLPHGIAPGDRLVDSLHKMGVDAEIAQNTVERAQKLFEGEQLLLGDNFFTLCITRNSYGEYVILYSFTASPVGGGVDPAEYSLEIIYAEANMTFQCFRIKAGYGEFSSDAFSAPITVAHIAQSSIGRELNAKDTQTLIEILYSGKWKNGEIDAEYDYCITSAGKIYRYSTSSGILANSGGYMSFSNENRLIVNEIVMGDNYTPKFQSIKLHENNLLAPVPEFVAQHLLSALNSAEWCNGRLEFEAIVVFDCDGTTVSYSGGIFFTTQHYWHADNYTKDLTNALHQALVGLRSEEYNAIIYYAGTYYGHSEAVDEKLNGTVNFSMNIQPQSLDDILYAHDDKQAVAAFGDIVDCKNAVDKGVLVTINGAYFEQITEFDPDFGKGEVKLIKTPAGEPPLCELTHEDAQMLREIFQRAEFSYCFMDHEAEYETTIEIGGYFITYLSAWGDARIGEWKATLSEQDTQTVGEILGGYVNVE